MRDPMPPVLESFDLDGVARYIQEHRCKQIVVVCGAGISTSAGIPDFRTPGTGLYDKLQRYGLPFPEAVFKLNFFREKPEAFYTLAKEMWPGNYDPTPTHYFLKLLSDKGILRRVYSQNFDSLETQAGLPRDKLVAAHGNFDTAHVIDTHPEEEADISELKAAIFKGEEGWKALREEKGNLVKPRITFFGEELPKRFQSLAGRDVASADLLIVLGTSLVVQPVCNLVSGVTGSVPRLLINREPAGMFYELRNGFRFETPEGCNLWESNEGCKERFANTRDAFYAGDCDSGTHALAKALGWDKDLETLVASKGAATVEPAPWV